MGHMAVLDFCARLTSIGCLLTPFLDLTGITGLIGLDMIHLVLQRHNQLSILPGILTKELRRFYRVPHQHFRKHNIIRRADARRSMLWQTGSRRNPFARCFMPRQIRIPEFGRALHIGKIRSSTA